MKLLKLSLMNNFGVPFHEINLRTTKIKECTPTLGVVPSKLLELQHTQIATHNI